LTIQHLTHFLKKYYFFDENSEPNKFTFEDDTIKAVSEWLIQFRVLAEERYAKYDACIIQDLIDRLEIPRKEEPKKHEEEPYYQEVCSVCGWASTPERGMPFGFGGTLDCPECRKVKRHPTLEGCYGSVKSFKVELPQKENASP